MEDTASNVRLQRNERPVPMGRERRQHEDGSAQIGCGRRRHSRAPAPLAPRRRIVPAVDRVHPGGYARSSLGAFSPRALVRTVVEMTSQNSQPRLSPSARLDVTDPASVEALIERTLAAYGRVDGGRLAGGA